MNGYLWRVEIVDPNDPRLVDRTNQLRVATTDPKKFCVYLSSELQGDFLMTVFIHELGHCTMISFNLLDDIHRMVRPKYWIEAEEWICNFIADYGLQMFKIAFSVVGDYTAWTFVPQELERLVS